MKIQNSRNSRQPDKDYSSVCHQQGRMLTDSDLTEQALLTRDRLDRVLRDVIGSGTPRHAALLRLDDTEDGPLPSLYWGRAYVDGVAGEVRPDAEAPDTDRFDYYHQRYYPEPPPLPEGAYRFYLDVWERSVIWLEDPALRDPGLHGADTTARTQTMAQVKWCPPGTDPLCPEVNPPLGDARLRLTLRSLSTSADPCDPCADELELRDRVGNYLFRVEIHDVAYDAYDRPRGVTLKWSSENGAEAYDSGEVPPGFADDDHVYEFFDRVGEMRLGQHLARDDSNQRLIDGSRPPLVRPYDPGSAAAREWVRRWDGWARLEKNGAGWQVVEGFEGSLPLSADVGAGRPGRVEQGGDTVAIELQVIRLEIELGDHPLLAGDFWTAPVREAIHQQGDVLLEGPEGRGAPPEGERHHYLLLLDLNASGVPTLPPAGDCDPYQACQPVQFPSLTDLRASDICFDGKACDMPQTATVQQALDQLCRERDLRWHNRHLHGWGVVCGLILECDHQNRAQVRLSPGYALDCEGNDMVLEQPLNLDIPELMRQHDIGPTSLNEEQRLCLYLAFDDTGTLGVRVALDDGKPEGWMERLRDSLIHDFYQDCIQELLTVFSGGLRVPAADARCVLTACGRQEIPPVQRRMLTLINLGLENAGPRQNAVLNLSRCEHELLHDLYLQLQELVRSRTYCGQFDHQSFPDYPFPPEAPCRATWFTPGGMDGLRLHPTGRIAFTWRRMKAVIDVYRLLKEGCLGDLVGRIEVPGVKKGEITDLLIDADDRILVSAVVHGKDTLFARGELPRFDGEKCEGEINWQTAYLCGARVVCLRQSPWSSRQIYALARCQGLYAIDPDRFFDVEKLEREPDWVFPASGHMAFDVPGERIICTAASHNALCGEGIYDRLALVDAASGAEERKLQVTRPMLGDLTVRGSDGLAVAPASAEHHETSDAGADGSVRSQPAVVLEQPPLSIARGGLVVFLVIDQTDRKTLLRLDAVTMKGDTWLGAVHHDFGMAGHVALDYASTHSLDGVVACRYATHDLEYIPGDPRRYQNGLRANIPVQAGPVQLQLDEQNGRLWILNHVGQSITLLDYQGIDDYAKERERLARYRAEVIQSIRGLFGNVLQYLKDCFCHHLLVKCPECDEEDKVYLGCLTLRENAIYNICNFSRRRYVKTFPAVAYWFSLLPIGPLVAWAVERLCCLVLPSIFQQTRYVASNHWPKTLGVASAALGSDGGAVMQNLASAAKTIGQKGLDQLLKAGLDTSRLAELDGTHYQYIPARVQQPQPVEKPLVPELVARVEGVEAKTNDEIMRIRQQMQQLAAQKTAEQQKTEARIRELESRLEAVWSEKEANQAEIQRLKKEKDAIELQLQNMRQTLAEFDTMRNQLTPLIEGAKPVDDLGPVDDATRRILKKNRITTIAKLADLTPTELRKMGIDTDTANSLVRKARARVRPR